jgi:hypothetical protein
VKVQIGGLPPGKYDLECETLLRSTRADAIILLVVNGTAGNGISVSFNPNYEQSIAEVPSILRALANGLERDLASFYCKPSAPRN